MDLSINLGYLRKRFGTTELRPFDETLAAAVKASFKFFDYNPQYYGEDVVEAAKRERTRIEVYFAEHYHRSFESAANLGAKYIVVHADEYRVTNRYDVDEIAEFTYNYIAPELAYAKSVGDQLIRLYEN